jgi:hypothetical protein
MTFGAAVDDPETLLMDGQYDVVICAGGRQALSAEWRAKRGLTARQGTRDIALILKFTGANSEATLAGESALTRSIGGSGRVYIRPGEKAGEGWAWLLGIPIEQTDRLAAALATLAAGADGAINGVAHASFASCLAAARTAMDTSLVRTSHASRPTSRGGGGGKTTDWLGAAMQALDAMLKPQAVFARVTEAGYWSSDEVVYSPRCRGRGFHSRSAIGDRGVANG